MPGLCEMTYKRKNSKLQFLLPTDDTRNRPPAQEWCLLSIYSCTSRTWAHSSLLETLWNGYHHHPILQMAKLRPGEDKCLAQKPTASLGCGDQELHPTEQPPNHNPYVGLNRVVETSSTGGISNQLEAPWRRAHIRYTVRILPSAPPPVPAPGPGARRDQYFLTAGSSSGEAHFRVTPISSSEGCEGWWSGSVPTSQ